MTRATRRVHRCVARAVGVAAVVFFVATAYVQNLAFAEVSTTTAATTAASGRSAGTDKPLCPTSPVPGAAACHAIVHTGSSSRPGGGPRQNASSRKEHSYPYKRLCSRPARRRRMACSALERITSAAQPGGLARDVLPAGYGPADLRSAYGLTGLGSGAETVAVVDAYDDPNAEIDLAAYRSQYGLPACTTTDGCFRKVDQQGGGDYPAPDPGWAGEASLDLDMVSAACPGCHILLVEAASADLSDLGAGVNEAVALGARFVSNSYGGPEDSGEAAADSLYFDHPGVAITAASGDSGYGAEYPATSQYVTAVGGTSLLTAANARGWDETVWSTTSAEGTGSGCSAVIPKPWWQSDQGCPTRTEADVAAVADPDTGVAVYDTYQAPGWNVYGGTSVGAPLIAGVFALAGTPGSSDRSARYPYQHASALWDVTAGSNGTCSVAYLCTAEPGYDGPTGWGTPDGVTAFSGQAAGDIVTVVNPGAQSTAVGASVSLQIQASDSGSSALGFTATGLPPGLSIDANTGVISGSAASAGDYSVTVTATDTTGASDSAAFAWTVRPAASVTNGGFESGDTRGWSVIGNAYVNHAVAHSGAYGLRLGRVLLPSRNSVASQTFTAAPGTSSLDLYYQPRCYDRLLREWTAVTLTDVTSRTTQTLLPPTCANSGWVQLSAAVTAGHTYTLVVRNHEGGVLFGLNSTYFDDVVVS